MKRLAILALAGVLILSGCSPSAEQLICEREGGKWVSYIAGYTTTYVYVGKVMVPQMSPIYMFRCDYE